MAEEHWQQLQKELKEEDGWFGTAARCKITEHEKTSSAGRPQFSVECFHNGLGHLHRFETPKFRFRDLMSFEHSQDVTKGWAKPWASSTKERVEQWFRSHITSAQQAREMMNWLL